MRLNDGVIDYFCIKKMDEYISNQHKHRLYLGIAVIAFLIRWLVHAFVAVPEFSDAADYLKAGKVFWERGYIHNYKVMPLYPACRYASEFLFGGPFLDMAADALSCYVLALFTEKHFTSRWAWISGLCWAFYPFAVFYANTGMSESLFVLLMVSAVYFLHEEKVFTGLALLVLAVLTRPVFDLLNPILVFVFSFWVWKKSLKISLFNVGKYFLVYVLFMAPWWIHNVQRYGAFVRTSLGDGQVLMEGSHPGNTDGGPIAMEWYVRDYEDISDPILLNEAKKNDAKKYISQDPVRFGILAVKKFFRFWNLVPNSSEFTAPIYRILAILSFGPVFLLSIMFVIVNRKTLRKTLPILLMVVYLTGIHMVTVASIRYRFPLEPFLLVLAVAFLGQLMDKPANKLTYRKMDCTF